MRTTHHRTRCGLTAALLCLALAGCTLPPPPPPGPPRQTALRYSRVAIVEFANRTKYPGRAEEFTQALREKLAEHTRNVDIVVVPRSTVFGDNDPFQSGRISIDALTRVRRDYLADALIVGSLDGLNPYRPPSLQLSMKVVETARGTVAYEVSDVWNAAESRVRSDINEYYRDNIGEDDCRFGPNMFLISPRYYMHFVAAQVVSDLTAKLAAAP